MIPHRTPFFLPHLFPSSLTWRFPETSQHLYLTFDDGPVPGPTEFVLDTLASYNCKATFFCIGDNIRKHPEVYKRIIKEGHATGNHTFNHLNGWKTSNHDYLRNIAECDQYLLPGRNSTVLFRPPYGRITWSQIKMLGHYRIVMWDVLSVDYLKSLRPEKCLRNSINATRGGSIIVFHDSHKAENNLMFALPRFIEHFLARGFEFRKIE
jgi:peptidoglycan/xylan/chitin deacetylase (PgdA/CDA1 family)